MKEYLADPIAVCASNNRQAVAASTLVGCFCCITIYPASEIDHWTSDGSAVCGCFVDTVLPDATCPVPITVKLLTAMEKRYFGF